MALLKLKFVIAIALSLNILGLGIPIVPITKLTSTHVLAQTVQDKINEANQLQRKVNKILSEDKYDPLEALPLLERVLEIYQEEEVRLMDRTRREERQVLGTLGAIHEDLKLYKKAINYYQQALLLYEFQSDKERALLKKAGLYAEADRLSSIGRVYQKLEQHQKAIGYYNRALLKFEPGLSIGYNKIITLMNLGKVYQTLGQHQKAINYLQQILLAYQSKSESESAEDREIIGSDGQRLNFSGRDHSIDAEALYYLAISYGSLGEYQKAIDNLEQARNIFQSLGDRGKAIEYFQQNFPEATFNSYKEVPQQYNEKFYLNNNYLEASSLYLIGLNYETLYKIQKIKGVNNDTLTWKEKAISSYAQALIIFQSLEHQEREAKIQQALRELTDESNSFDSNQTQEQDPQSAEEYYSRGITYHKQNEDDLAIADYTQVIKLDPNNEKALINRGLLYAQQDKEELALADYSQAIEVNPNHSGSYRNRGVLYFEQEEYELAEGDWNKAIEVNSEDAQAYFNRGLLFQKLGNDDSAQADLEKAHQLAISQDNNILAQQIATVLEQL